MAYEISRVSSFHRVAPFTLSIQFDDDTSQIIDFRPVLKGEAVRFPRRDHPF
jgi:hypothetical protein